MEFWLQIEKNNDYLNDDVRGHQNTQVIKMCRSVLVENPATWEAGVKTG